MFTTYSYDTIVIFSGEPLLFKSSFTPVYDFGFVGLAVNKVSDQQCDRHHWSPTLKAPLSPINMVSGVSGRLWRVCGSGDKQIWQRSDGWVRRHH